MPESCRSILNKMVYKKAMTEEERDKIARNLKTQKTGKWVITKRNGILCGVCHSGLRRMPTIVGRPIFRYCPFCGAEMEGEADAD